MHQKEITIINLYAPSFTKHTLKDLKAHMDSNTVVVGDFNTTLSLIDRSSKKKSIKTFQKLKHTIDKMDLAYVYKIFHSKSAQYTFFSAAHATFSKTVHILGQKQALANIRN
jgi:exonuclease III